MNYLYPILLLIVVVIALSISTFIMMSNHWEKLKYYQVKSKRSGSKSFIMLVNFGVTNLRGTVMARSDQNGMFMTPIFLGYKPLPTVYIPWNEISVKKDSLFLSKFYELSVGRPLKTRFCIKPKSFERLKNVA
jgi:hypothetical protein